MSAINLHTLLTIKYDIVIIEQSNLTEWVPVIDTKVRFHHLRDYLTVGIDCLLN